MISLSLLQLFSSVSQFVPSQIRLSMGLIVLTVIEVPVVILLIASVLSRPKSLKVTGLFLGWLFLMFAIFLGAIYVLGAIFGLFF